MSTGRPLLFKTPEALKIKCDAYFELMDAKQRPYTVSGLAVFLGTSRRTLLDYEDGEHSMTDEEKKAFSHTIKEAKERCEAYAEEQLFIGKNPHGVQFSLKNNFGWRDKNEIDMTSKGDKVATINYIIPQKQNEPGTNIQTAPGVADS